MTDEPIRTEPEHDLTSGIDWSWTSRLLGEQFLDLGRQHLVEARPGTAGTVTRASAAAGMADLADITPSGHALRRHAVNGGRRSV